MSAAAGLVDRALEFPIAPSFTRLGYKLRSSLLDWTDLDDLDGAGKTVVLTGATSGLGLAAAHRLAAAGATLVIIGRDPEKTERVRSELARDGADVSSVVADMAERDQVRRACDKILDAHPRIDVLIHNAGALTAERHDNSEGVETTVASQVVGPFLMTHLLIDALGAGSGRVITMSSGGMYSSALRVDGLQMTAEEYRGSEQYARAKRAQVTLNEMWSQASPHPDVRFDSLHPGWADTPGVEAALPTFRRIVGPALRTPDEGADTMVWLALADEPDDAPNGSFWLDRAPRAIHRLPRTRRSDTPERRGELWALVSELAGLAGVA
jgi:NAD(P)-dependent dehydrogenase (short-subunit alcohol dehydrogenase family)